MGVPRRPLAMRAVCAGSSMPASSLQSWVLRSGAVVCLRALWVWRNLDWACPQLVVTFDPGHAPPIAWQKPPNPGPSVNELVDAGGIDVGSVLEERSWVRERAVIVCRWGWAAHSVVSLCGWWSGKVVTALCAFWCCVVSVAWCVDFQQTCRGQQTFRWEKAS